MKGNQAYGLKVGAFLCNPNRLTLRKESNFLYIQKESIQHFANQSPLVEASKFILPRKERSHSNSLINWDSGINPNYLSDTHSLQTSDLLPEANANYYPYEQENDRKTIILDTIADTPVKQNKKSQTKSGKKNPSKSKAKKSSKKSKAIGRSLETSVPVCPQTILPQTPEVTPTQ